MTNNHTPPPVAALVEALEYAVNIIKTHVPIGALGQGGDTTTGETWPIRDEYLHYMNTALQTHQQNLEDWSKVAALIRGATKERELFEAEHGSWKKYCSGDEFFQAIEALPQWAKDWAQVSANFGQQKTAGKESVGE